AREMFVCFAETCEACEQEAEIIFGARTEARVPGLFEMEAGRGQFDERPISVVLSLFSKAERDECAGKRAVKDAHQRIVAAGFDERSGLRQNGERVCQATVRSFDFSTTQQRQRSQLACERPRTVERFAQQHTGFV